MIDLFKDTLWYVLGTLVHNGPVLLAGILIAAGISVYLDAEKFRLILMKKSNVSIPATVAFGAFTPFCACGTMAVIVAMLTTALPWGPIMAFLTSSPLMSPDEFVFISGIVSVKFAVALTIASVMIGLASGVISHWIEKKTHFLDHQARFRDSVAPPCCSGSITQEESDTNSKSSSCSCGDSTAEYQAEIENQRIKGFINKYKLKELVRFSYEVGIKQVLLYFSIFAAIGYLINRYVPAELITRYLGEGNIFAVPLLALIGLPLYVTGPSSLPLINALMTGGASGGAMLAFMITGPGTSAGVIAGIATIMRGKAIMLYVGFLMAGAILLGYLYDLLLYFGI